MKNLLLFAAVAVAGFGATTAFAAPLHLTVSDIQGRGGNLLVQVQSRAQYMGAAAAGQAISPVLVAGSADFDIDVPPGDYAVSVLHDANGSFSFDKGEGVGASNLQPTKGRPTFDAAKIVVGPKGADAAVTLHYLN